MRIPILTVLSLVVTVLVLWTAEGPANADTGCLGFPLPSNAQRIEPNRFVVGQSWEQVMTFYRRAFEDTNRVKRFLIVSIPGVMAMHFRNVADSSSWAGVNVSRIKGKIYVFCYPKDGTSR